MGAGRVSRVDAVFVTNKETRPGRRTLFLTRQGAAD